MASTADAVDGAVAKPASTADAVDGAVAKPKPTKNMCSVSSLWRYSTCMDLGLLFFGFLAVLISAGNQPVQLWVFGRILDSFNGADKAQVIDNIHFFALCYALLGVQIIFTTSIQIGCFSWVAARQVREVRNRYFRALLGQPPSYYDTRDCGALSTSVLVETTTMAAGIGDSLAETSQRIGAFIIGLGVAFYFAWRLALVVSVGLPVLGVIVAFAQATYSKWTRDSSKSSDAASSEALETISGIRTVAALGHEHTAMQSYQKSLQAVCHSGILQGRAKAALEGVMSPIIFVLFGLGLWYGSHLISSDMDDKPECRWGTSVTGELTEPDPSKCHTGGIIMTAFLSVLFGFLGLLQAMPGLSALAAARVSAASLYETIEAKPEAIDVLADQQKHSTASQVQGRIELSNVTFSYPMRPDTPVYNSLSLVIEAGQTVALVGPSGCGKSTLVALLERFYDIDSGNILLDGQSIRDMSVSWLRSQIGLVSQEPILFEGSIAWNISLGLAACGTEEPFAEALSAETLASVQASAKLANAHGFIEKFPDAYNTFVGEKGVQLSGGQKQRIAIARSLIRDPAILVLDEATSALDTASERLVQAALDEVIKGKKRTTIIIAHRLTTIRDADKIAVISGGKVAEEGSHSELMSREGGAYKLLVQSQLEGSQSKADSSVSTEQIQAFHRAVSPQSSVSSEQSPKAANADKSQQPKTPAGWLWRLSKPEAGYLVTGLIGAAITGLAQPAIGFLMAEFIVVFFNTDANAMRTESVKWAIVFMSFGAVSSLGAVLRLFSFSVITERMAMRVRAMAYRCILQQDIGWFDTSSEHTAGALVSQLSNDCFLLKALTGERASLSLSQFVVLGGGLYVSFTASWQLTLIVFGIIPLIALPVVIQAKIVARTAAAGSSSFVDAGRNAAEALVNLRTVAALGVENNRINNFASLLVLPYQHEVRKGMVAGVGTGIAAGTILFGAAFKYYIGGILFDEGIVEFNDIMRCVLVLIFMAFGMSTISKQATDKAEASAAAARVHKLVTSESAIDPLSKLGDAPSDRPLGKVEFVKVSFAYPARKDVQVYKNMSLTIEAGQTVALVGPSGCGKSTLVALLERFYNIDGGKILLDGIDIRTLNVAWLRKNIGLVSQEPVLFSGSIAWNIGLGLNPEDKTKNDADSQHVMEAARKANAHTFITELQDGYDTRVGESAVKLSGGQKQRIAIARAIVRNPPILILDEATSALDATSERVVQAALGDLLQESSRTTIVIAHRLSTIRDSDKIAVFSDGLVVEEGSHDQLMRNDGGVYRALVAHAEHGAEGNGQDEVI